MESEKDPSVSVASEEGTVDTNSSVKKKAIRIEILV